MTSSEHHDLGTSISRAPVVILIFIQPHLFPHKKKFKNSKKKKKKKGLLANISIGSTWIGFNSCGQETALAFVAPPPAASGTPLASRNKWKRQSVQWRAMSCPLLSLSHYFSSQETVLQLHGVEYGCVCLNFFPAGWDHFLERRLSLQLWWKDKHFWSQSLISSFPSLPLAMNVIPPGPWYSAPMLDSMIVNYCSITLHYLISSFLLYIFCRVTSWVYCFKIRSNDQTVEREKEKHQLLPTHLGSQWLPGQCYQLTEAT